MNDTLTVFYNKRTGSIKELCGGKQDMNWFGEEKQDFELIFDFVHVPFDSYIFENFTKMEVVEGKVKLKGQEVPEQYLPVSEEEGDDNA